MKGYIVKGELNKDMYMSRRVATLLREIIDATRQGGQIKITFRGETEYDGPFIYWETEDES